MPKMLKAGKRTAKEIKQFLEASYNENPPKEIDGFILDEKLSKKTGVVYYNPDTGEAIVAHRGTSGVEDWANNLAYTVGAYEKTARFKKGKKLQEKAEEKYGAKNISTLGHSQGSIISRKSGKDTKEIINVNPAYLGEKIGKNEYNIRSETDIISGLYAPIAKARKILYPKHSEKHDITIPSKNPTDFVGEHSYKILDRLDENKEIGSNNKISSNNIMSKGGRRYSRLGYSSDDIDYIGGKIHIGKTFKKVGKDIGKVSKGLGKVGTKLGAVTNDYILPAVVSAGKPIYDATAMSASTMLTGNPALGKVAGDALWDNMVEKKGIDPRDRQKSKALGKSSGAFGKIIAKPYSVALGGMRLRGSGAGASTARVTPQIITEVKNGLKEELQHLLIGVRLPDGFINNLVNNYIETRIDEEEMFLIATMMRNDMFETPPIFLEYAETIRGMVAEEETKDEPEGGGAGASTVPIFDDFFEDYDDFFTVEEVKAILTEMLEELIGNLITPENGLRATMEEFIDEYVDFIDDREGGWNKLVKDLKMERTPQAILSYADGVRARMDDAETKEGGMRGGVLSDGETDDENDDFDLIDEWVEGTYTDATEQFRETFRNHLLNAMSVNPNINADMINQAQMAVLTPALEAFLFNLQAQIAVIVNEPAENLPELP